MADKVKTDHEILLKVKVLVDADEIGNYKGTSVSRDSVAKAVTDALELYREEMADAIASSGDWDDDSEVIGSIMNFEVN